MPRHRYVSTLAAECCGTRYRHSSPSFLYLSTEEDWTDGWSEHDLVQNDEGLRRCRCGRVLLISDLVDLHLPPTEDLPDIDGVSDDELADLAETADREAIELAARLRLWRHLNHPYRPRYREHRDAEECANEAAWLALPDPRRWWERLLGRDRPAYAPTSSTRFTVPPFELDDHQRHNLERLVELLSREGESSVRPNVIRQLPLVQRAEACRELGRFDEAERTLSRVDLEFHKSTRRLIGRCLRLRITAPVYDHSLEAWRRQNRARIQATLDRLFEGLAQEKLDRESNR